jgi:hypothetical protein
MNITKDDIEQLFANIGQGYEVTWTYSGRSMYGKQCLAVTLEQYESPAQFMFQLGFEIKERYCDDDASEYDVYDLFCEPREDSMGRGSVIYWPSISLDKLEE